MSRRISELLPRWWSVIELREKGLGYSEIARRLGYKAHASVIHAVKQYEYIMQTKNPYSYYEYFKAMRVGEKPEYVSPALSRLADSSRIERAAEKLRKGYVAKKLLSDGTPYDVVCNVVAADKAEMKYLLESINRVMEKGRPKWKKEYLDELLKGELVNPIKLYAKYDGK